MTIPRKRLRAKYPCCCGETRLLATMELPLEKYHRTCPRCGKAWEIERTIIRERQTHTIHRLVWAWGDQIGGR